MNTQNCIDTIEGVGASLKPKDSVRAIVVTVVRRTAIRVVDTLILWQERARQRHHLAALDPALLKDIGVNRADAWQEANKPFWRP